MYPDFIEQEVFPKDVNERAKRILNSTKMSLGCYSEAQGFEYVRKNVASYIEKRDGYAADKNTIFLTNGAETSIQVIFYLNSFRSFNVLAAFAVVSLRDHGLNQVGGA